MEGKSAESYQSAFRDREKLAAAKAFLGQKGVLLVDFDKTLSGENMFCELVNRLEGDVKAMGAVQNREDGMLY